jgi:hypothetical protein
MENLNNILSRLHDARVEFVLVGGLAAVVHGGTLVTQDVDVCCRFTPDNLQRLGRALAGLHPVHRLTPQKLPFELSENSGAKNLYLQTDMGVLDCIGEVLGVGGYEEVFQRSVTIALPFGECRVLDLDTLIVAKEAMNRPHDRITVSQLKSIRERLR